MRRTRVRVRVEFEDCDVRTAEGDAIGVVSPAGDGCFEIDFDASLDLDIDTNETALTRACSPALRDALRARLAHVAKKRALKAAGTVSRVVSCTPYPVDSEIGRFRIPTYEVQGARATVRTRDMFPPFVARSITLPRDSVRSRCLMAPWTAHTAKRAGASTASDTKWKEGLQRRHCTV